MEPVRVGTCAVPRAVAAGVIDFSLGNTRWLWPSIWLDPADDGSAMRPVSCSPGPFIRCVAEYGSGAAAAGAVADAGVGVPAATPPGVSPPGGAIFIGTDGGWPAIGAGTVGFR